MSAINFNTANQTLRQLLGNGLIYRVPRFQRDYSWTSDEWEDLWHDIQGALPGGGEPAHYMGYLVLQTQDNKSFDVIDGQQRLTTLSLLILAVLKALNDLVDAGVEAENNRLRIEQLRSSYIGYLDPVTLIPQTKLTLNRNNDGYYKDYLVPLVKLPQRGLRGSEHLLRKGFEYFYKAVRDLHEAARDGARYARLVDEMSDRLFFTVITVTDELNAFKVFETLNARGVRLSPTDLLKNYLFSVVHRETTHPQELETLERRWEAMVDQLGGESFPNFLRVHWNSRRRFVREAELFKTIREDTPNKRQVFELIRQMEQDIEAYAALPNPEHTLWTEEQKPHVRELRMFSVRQPWALLLAAHRAFDAAGFTQILRACSTISFRYNVIGGLVTNEQERVYNTVAQKIASAQLGTPADVIRALSPIYIPDDQFRTAFASKSLRTRASRNTQVARYILFRLERQRTGIDYDVASPKYTLEHVLPEHPAANWPSFSDSEIDEFVYRIGNFALLAANRNRDLGNLSFDDKKETFAASEFYWTQSLSAEAAWTPERLAERQRAMAREATAVWRIAQLSL